MIFFKRIRDPNERPDFLIPLRRILHAPWGRYRPGLHDLFAARRFHELPEGDADLRGNETFCGIAPSIEAALNRYGAAHETIVGEGLFHCYPFFPVAKETRADYDLLIQILNKD